MGKPDCRSGLIALVTGNLHTPPPSEKDLGPPPVHCARPRGEGNHRLPVTKDKIKREQMSFKCGTETRC